MKNANEMGKVVVVEGKGADAPVINMMDIVGQLLLSAPTPTVEIKCDCGKVHQYEASDTEDGFIYVVVCDECKKVLGFNKEGVLVPVRLDMSVAEAIVESVQEDRIPSFEEFLQMIGVNIEDFEEDEEDFEEDEEDFEEDEEDFEEDEEDFEEDEEDFEEEDCAICDCFDCEFNTNPNNPANQK